MKHYFRKKFVSAASSSKMRTSNALHSLTSVWEAVDSCTTANCLKKAGFVSGVAKNQIS
jgi:hypothetical protein